MLDRTEIQDNVSDLAVTTAPAVDAGFEQYLDDVERNRQAELDAEMDQQYAEQLARRTLGKIDPATAPALARLVTEKHGQAGFYDVEPDGTVILHAQHHDLEPTELDALRGYVAEHNAAKALARYETRVAVAGKRFEASVKTPAGRVVKVGRFFNEREAWEAAAARLAILKASAA